MRAGPPPLTRITDVRAKKGHGGPIHRLAMTPYPDLEPIRGSLLPVYWVVVELSAIRLALPQPILLDLPKFLQLLRKPLEARQRQPSTSVATVR